MPSDAANRFSPCHTRIVIGVNWKAFHGHWGTRGSGVPLLQCSRRGHLTRTHLPQSRGTCEPAHQPLPHAISRMLKRLGDSSPR